LFWMFARLRGKDWLNVASQQKTCCCALLLP
jgi:hypothetical protein